MKYLSRFLSKGRPALLLYLLLGPCLLAEQSGQSALPAPSPVPAVTPPAGSGGAEARPLFGWNLLWAGSWEEGKNLFNRGDFRLKFPGPGLVLRAEVLDRRPMVFDSSPPLKDFGEGISNYAGGLYHNGTGSRLLYGVLDEWGLPARVRSPWIRAVPFPENHKPSMAELKTAVSVSGEPETYLYLGSPRLDLFGQLPIRGFAAAQIDKNSNSGFGGGLEASFGGGREGKTGGKSELRLDGFYTGKTLPARESSSWFSQAPPLPPREFRFYALGLLFTGPALTLSSDWAWSETFAWGRDLYGNLGLRFAHPPAAGGRWSLSLAADSAGSRYVGRDGSVPGAAFRSGGKFELYGKRSSLFRFNTSLRAPGFGEDFDRSSSSLSYRFPARGGKGGARGFRFSRISLGADRKPDKGNSLDGINLGLGFSLNLMDLFGLDPGPGVSRRLLNSPLGFSLSGSLNGTAPADGSPYPLPQNPYQFDSAKTSGEIIWSPGIFQFRTKLGYGLKNGKEGTWETSTGAAVRLKPGRLSAKLSSPDFPDEWAWTISWRLEKK
jgi:hypothetical protein